MDTKLVLLALYLGELGVNQNIDNKEKRLILQKAVYLGQAAGGDLGYRYNWYINGPYSTDLTKDYYKLAEVLRSGETTYPYVLRDDFKASLLPVKHLMEPPAEINNSQDIRNPVATWLELLASIDYSMRVLRMPEQDAREYVAKHKLHLAPFVDLGLAALRTSPLNLVGH